jgi:hypothetical protein
MSDNAPIKLRIPRQDLAECTLFRSSADAAQIWAKNLPIANTRLVVQKLRSAISELNRVELAPDVRFNIMEALRPSLHVALSTMSRRFLNQPLIMPEEPRQMAELADQLYSLATTGYTIVAVHTLQQRDQIYRANPARLLCEAIHRALNFTGKKMLQTFQLHQPIAVNGWLELNQLYAIAERQQVADLPVVDKHDGNRTITTIYLQSLMLGCCKPNQLRQSDLAAVYRGLQEWRELIQLSSCDTGPGLFQVDLGSDQPAMYASGNDNNNTAHCRKIDTRKLVSHLKKLKERGGQSVRAAIRFDKDTSLPPNMLDHLINALGTRSTRNFSRTLSGEMLGVSIGLSSTHYHMAGRKTFEQVLYGMEYVSPAAERTVANRFLEKPEARDNWEQANPHDDHTEDEQHKYHGELVDDPDLALLESHESIELPPEERYRIYPVHLVDASPGGYCMEWSVELPPGARTGDIIGIRESGRSEWVIAVIRWVSQIRDAKSLIGVELLSPKAMPYGARIQQKTGVEAPLRRVLLLPEIKLVGQPHTLITPRAGFKERQKVTLLREGEEFLVQLLRQISATGNFSQFDFRYIKHLEQVVAEDKTSALGSAYDSLWSSI